jgi:F-type H+-transporting ATPase subunit a
MPGVPVPVKVLLAPIELVGTLTKPFALMVRLFANITAGHIVVLSLISLIFIFKSEAASAVSVPFALFISVLELLVAALQAYVFTMLSALFIGQAVAEHEHHHEHHH